MTIEWIKTIPDLEDFTGQEYASGGSSIRRAYINTIFLAHNLQLPSTHFPVIVYRSEEGTLVGTFLKESSYGPSTKLAQLVQVIVCMATFEINIREALRTKYRRDDAQKTAKTVLPEIRRVKQEIAQEIFGDDSVNYTQRLSGVFFAHRFKRAFPMPGASDYKRKQERNRMLDELITEISTRFPLTSK